MDFLSDLLSIGIALACFAAILALVEGLDHV
jgi:hypothetical protein